MSVPFARTTSLATLPHVQDGDLVGLHDGELPDAVAEHVAAHLATCVPCAERSEALRRLSARLHAAVHHRAAFPAVIASPPWHWSNRPRPTLLAPLAAQPARRRGASAAGAAAALALLAAAAAAAATPSVRAVVATWVRPAPDGPAVSRARASGTGGASGVPIDAHGGELAFTPSDDTLRIAMNSAVGDSLFLRTSGSTAVHVRFQVIGAGPTILTLPDRLRLASAEGSRTIFFVDVPSGVRVVEVSDERRARVRTLRPPQEDGARWRVALP
jgi:hypothetical protein